MKITWKFANDESITLEVADDIGKVILESRLKESNLEKKENKHCYLQDPLLYDRLRIRDVISAEDDFEIEEFSRKVYESIEQLTPIQKRRMEMYIDGTSQAEIADIEGISQQKVSKAIIKARANLKKILEGEV